MSYKPKQNIRRQATIQLAPYNDFCQVGDRATLPFVYRADVIFVGYYFKVLTPGDGTNNMVIDIRFNDTTILNNKIEFDMYTLDSTAMLSDFSIFNNPATTPRHHPYMDFVVEQSFGVTDPKGVYISLIWDEVVTS